uniref:Uncharacterized protein n=1 Tax=Cacopsylla melanoneura TaxID=428564 RepID=A0A8D8ZAE4_9HEMI
MSLVFMKWTPPSYHCTWAQVYGLLVPHHLGIIEILCSGVPRIHGTSYMARPASVQLICTPPIYVLLIQATILRTDPSYAKLTPPIIPLSCSPLHLHHHHCSTQLTIM